MNVCMYVFIYMYVYVCIIYIYIYIYLDNMHQGYYLVALNLSGNVITWIPYSICELSNLMSLRMEGCKLAGRLTQVCHAHP
jgi:hypothetical protein